jgi:hypothetical protein
MTDKQQRAARSGEADCSGASVDDRLDALHSLTRRSLAKRTDGGLYAATAYHLAARYVRQNNRMDGK